MSNLNDDKEFVSVLNERYAVCINRADDYAALSKKAIQEAESIKSLIDIYNSRLGIQKNEIQSVKPQINAPTEKVNNKLTFEDVILDILKDGTPRTTKALLEEYAKLGRKDISVKDFSSKLSIRASTGKKLKNLKFPEYPIDQRFWWGLIEWFDGNKFKEEYENKIRSYMDI